jgi:hypothetical protein
MVVRVARMLHVSWLENERVGARAAKKVSYALLTGKLPRLTGSIPCTDCGEPARYYDHRNYYEPLKVEPVCGSCNQLRGPGFPKLRMTDFEDVRCECRDALKGISDFGPCTGGPISS